MTTTFHVEASELDNDFLKEIKSLFGEKKLVITVEEDDDATMQLLSSESNRTKFRKSIDELNNGDLIAATLDDLRK